jgi:AcrR family transcriptional regulator
MAERVKPRRYHSPRREQQAAATRAAILEAAQRLFERDGYAATTMAAIAKEAGVALKTVYLAFETKSGLLRALWHLLLRGDEEDVPIDRRPWYQAVLAEPDAERALRLGAHQARLVKERAGALLGVIRAAAAVDPDAAELWGRIESEFYDNQKRVVQALHDKGALRPGLGVERGADIMWTLNHPELWHLLVGARGWSPAQYERWFGDTVVDQLLGRGAVASGGSETAAG